MHSIAGISLRESIVAKPRSLCDTSHRWRGSKHRAALKRVPDDCREDERRSDAGLERPLGLVEAPGVLDGHFVTAGNSPAGRPDHRFCFLTALSRRAALFLCRSKQGGCVDSIRWLVRKGFCEGGCVDTPNAAELKISSLANFLWLTCPIRPRLDVSRSLRTSLDRLHTNKLRETRKLAAARHRRNE